MRYLINKKLSQWPMLIVALAVVSSSACWAEKNTSWNTASDALAFGLPVAVGVLTVWREDLEGVKQLALSGASTLASSQLLKEVVHAQRPDGSDNKSFPSAHTAVAFTAATFLDRRYGQQLAPWQIAAVYGTAAFVGVARVQADKHRWSEVAAGAALGYAASHYWTRPVQTGQLAFLPASGGVAVAWTRSFH